MRLIFVAPSTPHPSGGVAVIYEFACAMARRGHVVHLYHVNFFQGAVSRVEDIPWFSFPEGPIHHFTPDGVGDLSTVPASDVIFGFSFDRSMPSHLGLPVVLIQGYRMLGDDIEEHAFRAGCLKVCVARWLVDIGLGLGVPRGQLVHVPLGLRHDMYRLTRPIGARPPRIAFCYSSHWQKGAPLAIEIVEEVKRLLPSLEVVAFGTSVPEHALPTWVDYVMNPSHDELVHGIYNGSRVFLCTSVVEGFGLPNVEAMAGGAALVTTDNGGSSDYAIHDQTALVAPRGDRDTLVAHCVSLLESDDRCARIATAGQEYVRRFDWGRSAELLEETLERYLADPVAFGARSADA